jgi:hypothetical protein
LNTTSIATTAGVMSAYVAGLNASVACEQAQRGEKERADTQAAREPLTSLEERLAQLLAIIPVEMLRQGFLCPRCFAADGAATVTLANWVRHYASLALRDGDGITIVAFVPCGIPPELDHFIIIIIPHSSTQASNKMNVV